MKLPGVHAYSRTRTGTLCPSPYQPPSEGLVPRWAWEGGGYVINNMTQPPAADKPEPLSSSPPPNPFWEGLPNLYIPRARLKILPRERPINPQGGTMTLFGSYPPRDGWVGAKMATVFTAANKYILIYKQMGPQAN